MTAHSSSVALSCVLRRSAIICCQLPLPPLPPPPAFEPLVVDAGVAAAVASCACRHVAPSNSVADNAAVIVLSFLIFMCVVLFCLYSSRGGDPAPLHDIYLNNLQHHC